MLSALSHMPAYVYACMFRFWYKRKAKGVMDVKVLREIIMLPREDIPKRGNFGVCLNVFVSSLCELGHLSLMHARL